MPSDNIPLLHRLEAIQLATDDRGRANFGSKYANKDLQVLMKEEIEDLDEISVYHGVHDTGVIGPDLRARLFAKFFGIHWFKEPYTARWAFERKQRESDEDDSKPDHKPLSDWDNLNALATNGGLLTLRDREYEPDHTRLMRFSLILPQTIMPLPFEYKGETHYLKTIEVHPQATFVVTDDDYEELFKNIAPRLGSIQKWDTHVDVPRRVYKELLKGS